MNGFIICTSQKYDRLLAPHICLSGLNDWHLHDTSLLSVLPTYIEITFIRLLRDPTKIHGMD